MPNYVPVVVALLLVAGPAAATAQPAQPAPRIEPLMEPNGARIAPLQPAPHIGPLMEPGG